MTDSKKIVETFLNSDNKQSPAIKEKFACLRKKKPKNLDTLFHDLHDEAFEHIDCLDCANCCKSISPGVSYKDVERLAKHLKIKPSDLVEEHFEMDSDGEYVFRQTPCPFLAGDNYCMVYEARPKACREYPHTDRRRMQQILSLTKKNTEICPAVHYIMERISTPCK